MLIVEAEEDKKMYVDIFFCLFNSDIFYGEEQKNFDKERKSLIAVRYWQVYDKKQYI